MKSRDFLRRGLQLACEASPCAALWPAETANYLIRRSTMSDSKEPVTSCKVIVAGTIAKSLLTEVRDGIQTLANAPHLLGILANDDPAAKLYAGWTQRTCEEKCA
jgi:hypothetical protein